MQNAAHAYLQTQVGTTGRGEIIVMLYDGALRFLAQAREKMEARDMAGKGMLISRALDIINELDSSLNMEAGGELARICITCISCATPDCFRPISSWTRQGWTAWWKF